MADLFVENEDGQVALQYYQPIQKYVQVGQSEYVFTVSANISMTWVNPGDVPAMLALRRTDCACASGNPVVFYANESSVRRWANGGGS